MEHESTNRLSRINTLWTLVCQAHAGEAEARTAQQELLRRYGRAVHRYLLGALRDASAAEELGQEFALRFLRGDLRGAKRERGRFRAFLTGVLYHLIVDHHRRQKKKLQQLPENVAEPAAPDEGPAADIDREFRAAWREELIERGWKALASWEAESGQPFHTVLRFRVDHQEMRSAAMAEQLSVRLGKAVTDAWVRQNLHRARDKFAGLLLDEVAQTLDDPTADGLEEELVELELLVYCQPALDRYRTENQP